MSAGPSPRGPATPDLIASALEDEPDRPAVPPWVWRVAGLLALAVVAALAGPDLLSSLSPRQPRSAASARHQAPGSPPNRPGTFLEQPRWVPRGPEVGSEIVAAELARIRVERPGVEGLLWAGSLDGHDHAILVAYPRQPTQSGTEAVQVVALHVRGARDVATARSESIGYLSESGGVVGVAWQGPDRHARLLLLGRPGRLRVQVSSVVDYRPSGGISRRWRDTLLTDGTAVVDLGRRTDPFLVVRPKIPGRTSSAVLVPVEGRGESPGDDRVTVAGVSTDSYAGPAARLLVHSLSQALGMLFDLGDADSTVLWSGRIAGGRTRAGEQVTGRGALVLVRRHDGPMFQAFVYADRRGGSVSYSANTVRWSVAHRLPFAFSTNEAGAPEVIVNPAGPGTATLTIATGERVRVRLDGNGVGILAADSAAGPMIGGAAVVVRDPSGHITVRSTMTDTDTADAFGRYL